MRLTKQFSADQYRRALEAWSWLEVSGKQPVLTTLFGDVVFRADDGFWFLDTLEGTLEHRWASPDEVRAALTSEQGQDEILLAGLAYAARDRGLVAGDDEVYDFAVPPVLGGAFDVSNLTVMEFVVSLHVSGQLARQVRDLPPGSKISGVAVDGVLPAG